LRKFIHKLTHRNITSAEQYWKKAALAGELNELFKRPVMSVDNKSYTLPFLANFFRGGRELRYWKNLDELVYEYETEKEISLADKRFESVWQMLDRRLKKEWSILDVGCNTGYMMQKFYELGFTKIHGIDPQKTALKWAAEHRPHLNIRDGFFEPASLELESDVIIFFKSIFRIPYQKRVFKAIEQNAKQYVVFEGASEMTGFSRDLHLEMAKVGFMCIEKRVFNENFIPIGYPGADEADVLIESKTKLPVPHDKFYSNYVFRRIEPRQ